MQPGKILTRLRKCNADTADQVQCSVSSDLRLYCLPKSHIWDSKHSSKVRFKLKTLKGRNCNMGGNIVP